MKIGIMGGTFNPIHNGHLIIAEQARQEYQLDLVLFIPAGIPPHKQQDSILNSSLRCEMIQCAIESNPNFILDTREVDSTEISYTYLTLGSLSEQYPDAKLYFIMGEDSIYAVSSWRRPKDIFSLATILIAVRNDASNYSRMENQITEIQKQYSCTLEIIHSPSVMIASSDIRSKVAKHQSIRYLVPDSVAQYIIDHDLYKMEHVQDEI